MPRLVDHEQRRAELVEATWRIVSTVGLDAATMRNVAAEAGFSNGAMKCYFATKDDLLALAFEYVYHQSRSML